MFKFQTPGPVFYIRFWSWSWNYSRHIRWSLYFYISKNARGFWSTSLRLGTEEKVELNCWVTLAMNLNPYWLWIGARRSYFRKSLGGGILRRSKTASGYVVESQCLVFWWNEGASKSKEPLSPIIFPPSATNASILAILYL